MRAHRLHLGEEAMGPPIWLADADTMGETRHPAPCVQEGTNLKTGEADGREPQLRSRKSAFAKAAKEASRPAAPDPGAHPYRRRPSSSVPSFSAVHTNDSLNVLTFGGVASIWWGAWCNKPNRIHTSVIANTNFRSRFWPFGFADIVENSTRS